MSWEGETGEGRADRRSRLIQLDRILETLEELNLRGEQMVPEAVRERLKQMGIPIMPQESPTTVLEKVLVVQEVYLLHPVPPSSKPWTARTDETPP